MHAGSTVQDTSGEAEPYDRYHVDTDPVPDVVDVPPRFNVDVGRWGLAKLLVKELIEYRNLDTVLSRPCVYGVFSGPLGGFAPREEKCVGCLRCTTQYPEFVEVSPNPDREALGDAFLTPSLVETILDEARTGQVPVKGQGYRGRFGGDGWDGMWTDMSEIVRPTRDGIHGREFISTQVDLGSRPDRLELDPDGRPKARKPRTVSVPIPMLLDQPPACLSDPEDPDARRLARTLARAAERTGTLALLPADLLAEIEAPRSACVPVLAADQTPEAAPTDPTAGVVETTRFEPGQLDAVRRAWPEAVAASRLPVGPGAAERVEELVEAGVDVVHLVFDYHGRSTDDRFVQPALRSIHTHLVDAGVRDRVTLVGSGGIVAAEHVPKAILSGLDAVGLDTALLAALQAEIEGALVDPGSAQVSLPDAFTVDWGVQRVTNLLGAWHDQLLEILGAMGMREVRRMRGEMGRAMYQRRLEREAFGDIEGFPDADGSPAEVDPDA